MGFKSKKQSRREKARLKHLKKQQVLHEPVPSHEPVREAKESSHSSGIKAFYENNYKALLLIPLILFILAISQIGFQYATTGDFMNKGVSLKGGITLTVPSHDADVVATEQALIAQFPGHDVSARALVTPGKANGMLIEAGITDPDMIKEFTGALEALLSIGSDEYTIETIGSSLGESFFLQTMKALFIAFLFMGLVVFLYFGNGAKLKIITAILSIAAAVVMFIGHDAVTAGIAGVLGVVTLIIFARNSVPSIAVIAAAVADIIITLAVINVMGIKMSPAAIAAFLMLIGYSVDTDILLSTRVLRRKTGTVMDGVYSALKTGITMTATTLIAVTVGLVLSTSPVLKEIMTIVFIGLVVDIISTWIQNVGLLRWYLEAKEEK